MHLIIKITGWKYREALFTSDRSAVHDLVLGDGVVFMVDAWSGARRLSLDDVDLHVLDLNPHKQEVDFPHNDIFQMVPVKTQMATHEKR